MTKRDSPFGGTPQAVLAALVLILAGLTPIRSPGGETLLANAATGAGLAAHEGRAGAVRQVALKRCLRVRRSDSANTVVNLCATCVRAKLEHRRPRGDFPIFRDVTVPRRGTIQLPLSFRKGSTRVLNEQRCGGGATGEANAEQCVDLTQVRGGGRLLVNNCRVCRTVVVERVSSRGDRSMRAYTVGAKTYIPYPATDGTDRTRVLLEKPCP
jgi:hypothetical protein